MDALSKFLDAIADLWEAAMKSPRAFFTVAVILVLLGYAVGAWYYSGRVSDAEARVALRDDEIKALREARGIVTQGTQAAGTVGALVSWGGGLPLSCGATLDRDQLSEYAGKYDVAVACGSGFQNIDKFADLAISVSDKFTLSETSAIPLAIPVSAPMKSALLKFVDNELGKRPPEDRQKTLFNVVIWYEVLLLPPQVLPSDIRTLADVRRLGGLVAPGHSRAVAVNQLGADAFKGLR